MRHSGLYRTGKRMVVLGILLVLCALALTLYNLWDSRRAQVASDTVLHQLVPAAAPDSAGYGGESPLPQPAYEVEVPNYVLAPNMAMPEQTVDGVAYIGVLEIPDLGLSLPVASSWNYELLRSTPCRYAGSAYQSDLVIAAHNYSHHFGGLARLPLESELTFTDVDGNVFRYRVVSLETLGPSDAEDMVSWTEGLTLFTCTVGGQSRVTIRGELVS